MLLSKHLLPVYAPLHSLPAEDIFRFLPGSTGFVTVKFTERMSHLATLQPPNPIIRIVQFKEAAVNAKKPGFDGVEYAGVSLLSTSSLTQRLTITPTSGEAAQRTVALEILKELIEVWVPDVAIKFSPAGGINDVRMPFQETIDTFGYLLREVDKLPLALVHYVENPSYDGKKRGTENDVVETGGARGKREGSGRGHGLDRVVQPDVARRIKAGKALDNVTDIEHVYVAEGVDNEIRIGYTDYPEAKY
ncbi:hypothetical protein B0H11DRAFT_2251957 [Mycena galericulata]|nr:hypothetical protein B0H11DRAFT_2251957 [Mycena galericulata]